MSYREKIDKEDFIKTMYRLLGPSDGHFAAEREDEVRKSVIEISWVVIDLLTSQADEDNVDRLELLAGLTNSFNSISIGIMESFRNATTYVMKSIEKEDKNPLGV